MERENKRVITEIKRNYTKILHSHRIHFGKVCVYELLLLIYFEHVHGLW